MALTAQHTSVWKARIEAYLDKAAIFVDALTNKNYQGELSANKTLNIITYGDITVSTYTGADITFDTPATTGDTFTLDQLKSFGFQVLRKDQYGSLEDLINQFSKRATIAMKLDTDAYIATLHSSITTNIYGSTATPKVIGFDSGAGEILPTQAMAEMFAMIGAENGNTSNVHTVFPQWLGKALIYELRTRTTAFGDSVLKMGVAPGKLELGGSVEGYTGIWVSNNVVNTAGAAYKVMLGSPEDSITFAEGIDEVGSGELQNNFGTYVKGLHIYGGKIPTEKHMALGTFDKGKWPNGDSL